jgi:hypothetical protein
MYSILDKPIMDFLTGKNGITKLFKVEGIYNERNIELFESYCCIVLSSFICYNLYLYYYVNTEYLNLSLPLIFSYFTFDFFICKYDIKFHHILIFLLISFNYNYNVSIADSNTSMIPLYKTEISTIFYSIKVIMKNNAFFKKYFSQINDILFITTFIKFRIYDLYNEVLINPTFYSHMSRYANTIFTQLYLYVPLYCFYGLNVYWFLIMCKIFAKPIIKKCKSYDLIKIREFLTQYTLFFNILAIGYIYSFSKKQYYIIDMTGITMLAMNSYIYHNKIYTYLCGKKEINYMDNDIIEPLLNDNLSIHVTSLLYNLTCAFSYDNSDIFAVFYISLIIHANAIYHYLLYIIKLKSNENKIIYENDSSIELISMTNFCTVLPVAYDILFGLFTATNINTKINISLASYILFLILYINPFYELNHFTFHIGLILQRIFISYGLVK